MKRWLVVAFLLAFFGACSGNDDGGGSDVGGSGGGNEGGTGGIGGTGGGNEGGTGGIGGIGGIGGENEGGTGGIGGTGGAEVVWEPCELQEYGLAECTTLSMPLDRDDPASIEIPFFVRRIKAGGPSRGQLWLLEGGPGINGGQLAYYAEVFLLDLDLDIYMPDYRGVGRSGELGCNGNTYPEWGCLAELEDKFGEDLVRFSTSDAVRDVGEAIQLFARPGEEVYVWGSSYGTATAHRFLHLFPDLANGVVLDSACGAEGCDIIHAQVDIDLTGRDIAELCADDEFCRSKMGGDPWMKIVDVLDRVEAGHCAAGVTGAVRAQVRDLVGQLMGPYSMPSLAMALIYRLDRCDEADATAVQNLFSIFFGRGKGWVIQDEVEQSNLLYFNIVYNEFWDDSLTVEEMEEINRDVVLGTPDAMVAYAEFANYWPWPRYEVPDDLRVWADVDTPVLILNGTLDAQTRVERMIDAREAFTRPNQHVVIVPYAGHGVSMPSTSVHGYTCGAEMTRQFLRAPTSALDTSCVDEQRPPAFDSIEYQSYWFGTPDLYENVRSAKPPITEIDDPLLKAKLARARMSLQRPLR